MTYSTQSLKAYRIENFHEYVDYINRNIDKNYLQNVLSDLIQQTSDKANFVMTYTNTYKDVNIVLTLRYKASKGYKYQISVFTGSHTETSSALMISSDPSELKIEDIDNAIRVFNWTCLHSL